MPRSAILASVMFMGLMVGAVHAGEPFQSQDRFATAIRDESTSPYFVLITVVDDRTGRTTTGCTTANFLLGAIHRENDLGYDSIGVRKAQEIALSNVAHVFHFSKQASLDNLAMNDKIQDEQKACAIIKKGQSARLADINRPSLRGALKRKYQTACKPGSVPPSPKLRGR